MIWRVPPLWSGGECWIIGGGPSIISQFGIPDEMVRGVCEGTHPYSAYSPYMRSIHDRHVIGVNNAYRLGAWVDILFFGDWTWYLEHRQELQGWPGLKISCNSKFGNPGPDRMDGIKYLARDREHLEGISGDPSKVSWNQNSGAAAINVAVHLGVKRIYLLGFDMDMDHKNNRTHWFGSHGPSVGRPVKPPPFGRHLRGFPAIAEDAKRMGVGIINVNPESKIDVFPKVALKDIPT